jgi:protein-disulfide isomerase
MERWLQLAFLKRSTLLWLLVCVGCAAQQSSAPADLNHHVERMIRAHFNLPLSVDVKVGTLHPSADFAGYDVVPVTLSRADKSSTIEFLLSRDGKRLIQTNVMSDPLDTIRAQGRPTRGNPNAKVTIVTYDDFECPYCSRNHQTLFPELLKQYGDRVRFVYKDYPLADIHPWAMRAAVDANCLFEQNNDAYWDFADYAHANQQAITGQKRPLPEQLSAVDQAADEIAKKRGLDAMRLQACIKAQNDGAVKASLKEADELGIAATPTMYINGLKLDGAVPPDELRAALDRALRDVGQTPGPAPGTAASVTSPSPGTPKTP